MSSFPGFGRGWRSFGAFSLAGFSFFCFAFLGFSFPGFPSFFGTSGSRTGPRMAVTRVSAPQEARDAQAQKAEERDQEGQHSQNFQKQHGVPPFLKSWVHA